MENLSPAAILAISPDLAINAEFALIELVGGTLHSYLRARRSAHGMPRVSRAALNANFATWAAPRPAFLLNTPFITR